MAFKVPNRRVNVCMATHVGVSRNCCVMETTVIVRFLIILKK